MDQSLFINLGIQTPGNSSANSSSAASLNHVNGLPLESKLATYMSVSIY